jgi:hypothetical protein
MNQAGYFSTIQHILYISGWIAKTIQPILYPAGQQKDSILYTPSKNLK